MITKTALNQNVLNTCSSPNSDDRQSLATGTNKKSCTWYSHPFDSIRIVELHVITSLDPADGPRLFAGYWRHQDPGAGSEVRCPVAQHHAGGLVDAGGVGVDGAGHLQDDDTVSETLGLTPDTLDTAHCIKEQHSPQQRPEVWRRKTHGHSKKSHHRSIHTMFSPPHTHEKKLTRL